MADAELTFSGAAVEPVNSPSWEAARPDERKRYYMRLGELIQVEMRDALRRGVDRYGRRMKPRKRKVLPDGSSGPPMTPHRADSRPWRLLFFVATDKSVRFNWRASGQISFRRIIDFHGEGAGNLPVRDIRGLAKRWLNRAVEGARLFWSNLHPADKWQDFRAPKLPPGGPNQPPSPPASPALPVVPKRPSPLVPPVATRPKPPAPMRFGPSKARVEIDDAATALIPKVVGRAGSARDVASLVGAPDDSTVSIKARKGRLIVSIEDPNERYLAVRILERVNGQLVIHNDAITILPAYQGQGLGASIFGRQVEQAAKLGASRIEARAERSPSQNGYYTWPRLGYDGPIPVRLRAALPASLRSARQLSDLMATAEGRAWWRANGDSVPVSFDLAAGSLGRKLLDAYLAEKRQNLGGSRKALDILALSPPTSETPDLFPGDDLLLDAICDAVLGGRQMRSVA